MMNDEELITNLSLYLEILVSENVLGPPLQGKQREQQFLNHIERNMSVVFVEASKHENIKKILELFVRQPSELTHPSERYWNFTVLCLTLMKGLSEVLLSQEKDPCSDELDVSALPKGALRVNQQNTVRRCLQFIIALGLLPNVIPSVRNVLDRRPEALNVIESFDANSTVQQKYYRLLATLMVLLECMKQNSLAKIIMQHHSGDILAALLQLCHAPIKKVTPPSPLPSQENVPESELESHQIEKYEDFNWVMSKLRACNGCTDKDFIGEMWEHRKYFQDRLTKYLSQLSTSVLMGQLLFLQGRNYSSGVEKVDAKLKAPPWLLKICNQMLTQKLFEPYTLRTFIQNFVDPLTDTNMDAGTINPEKIDTFSRIISHNPVRHIPLDVYMREISTQLKILLQMKGPETSKAFPMVAAGVIVNFAQRNFDLTEAIISQSIFTSFWLCLQNTSRNNVIKNGEVVVTEEQITICIDDAYEVFISYRSVLSDEALALLLPFYHLLFVMYMKLINGVSYLKAKVKALLVVILNHVTSETSMKLLKVAAFEDTLVPNLPFALNMKCVYGENGGIKILRNTNQSEEMPNDMDVRCQAILELLEKVTEKKVKTSFFLSLIRKSVHLEQSDPDYIPQDDVEVFVNTLIAIRLLEQLSDIICEDLINNIEEAVEIIKVALESLTKDPGDNPMFSDDTVMALLMILSTLIGYKTQLLSSHWRALKACVEPLTSLIASTTNTLLKSLAEDIRANIQVHGAIISEQSAYLLSQQRKKSSQLKAELTNDKEDSKKLIEEINNLVLAEGDFFYKEIDYTSPSDNIGRPSKKGTNLSPFRQALLESKDASVPVRGHSLINLYKLVETRDPEALFHKEDIFEIFQRNLSDEDSYVYLPAIRGLAALGDVDPEMVLPMLLAEFKSQREDKWSVTLKVGEALLRICRNMGDLSPKFRDEFLNTYLFGVRHQDPYIRASSLSNLGEVCKALRFSIGPMLQEILLCITSAVKTDQSIEVRRAAVLVIVLILRGTGIDTIYILRNEIKDLRILLEWVYNNEKDMTLKQHALEGLEELRTVIRSTLQIQNSMIKEIRVLDQF